MDNQQTYQKFAKYYDAYVGGFCADLSLYHAFCGKAEPILEVGCGTGRVLRSFLEAGYPITGVDISGAMLEIAAAKLERYLKSGRLRLTNHNFVTAALPETFQRVWVTFYTFNYLLRESEALSFLGNIRASLAKGALLMLDLFYPDGLAHPERDNQWREKSFPDGVRMIQLRDKRTFDGTLEERIQIFTDAGDVTTITTLRRYYSKAEVGRLLDEAGYHGILFGDGYRGDAFHPLADDEATTAAFMVMAGN